MSNESIDPETILRKIEGLIDTSKGGKITLFRGDTPVYRAKIKRVELFDSTLIPTTTGTEVHSVVGDKKSWNPTRQSGETRTAIRLNEYTVHKIVGRSIHLTKPAGLSGSSRYVIEPITD